MIFVHKRVRTKARKTKAYVNNKDFYQAIVDFYALKEKNKEEGTSPPPIPRYLGDCVYKICEKLSGKPNFYGYSYRDEMIADAVLNCCEALNNEKFDAKKYNNPFAYFTSIAYNAFLRRLKEEKDEAIAKVVTFEHMFVFGNFDNEDTSNMLQFQTNDSNDDLLRNHYDRENKRKAQAKPKKKKAKKTVFG